MSERASLIIELLAFLVVFIAIVVAFSMFLPEPA